MQIHTKFIGPTNFRGARIKVWTEWHRSWNDSRPGPAKLEKTYSYSYEMNDAHNAAVLQYITDYPDLVRHSDLFGDDPKFRTAIDRRPDISQYYIAATERGYIYTQCHAQLEETLREGNTQ